MKKLTLSLIAIFALAFVVNVEAAFNTNLKQGSKGPAVVALQDFLSAKGYLTGSSTGYYGSATKAAVKMFQKENGITATGNFYKVTRMAADEAMMAGNGTTSTTTGTTTSAATTTQAANCEATLDITNAPSVVSDFSVVNTKDVPVYGLRIKETTGKCNAKVQTLSIKTTSTVGTSFTNSENPMNLIGRIYVKDGSTTLAEYSVDSGTFIKDSENKYYLQLTGLGLNVPAGQTKELVVSVDTRGANDVSRRLLTEKYGTNPLRFESGNGLSQYHTLTGITARTKEFLAPGTSAVVTVNSDSATVRSKYVKLNKTASAKNVQGMNFRVKAESGSVSVLGTTVIVTSSAASATPTSISLMDGSTVLDVQALDTTLTTNNVVFKNFTSNIPTDTTKMYTIKYDMPSSQAAIAGNVTVEVDKVEYERSNGQINNDNSFTNIVSEKNFFGLVAPEVALSSTSVIAKAPTAGSASSQVDNGVKATFVFDVKANGGDIVSALASNGLLDTSRYSFEVKGKNSDTNTAITPVTKNALNVSLSEDKNISDGTSAKVTVEVEFTRADLGQAATAVTNVSAQIFAKELAFKFNDSYTVGGTVVTLNNSTFTALTDMKTGFVSTK